VIFTEGQKTDFFARDERFYMTTRVEDLETLKFAVKFMSDRLDYLKVNPQKRIWQARVHPDFGICELWVDFWRSVEDYLA
jgi:hypothetical protein